MGHRTPEMRAAFLEAAVLAWRSLTRVPGEQTPARPLPEHDVYPSQLHGILGIQTPAAVKARPIRAIGSPPARAPRR